MPNRSGIQSQKSLLPLKRYKIFRALIIIVYQGTNFSIIYLKFIFGAKILISSL